MPLDPRAGQPAINHPAPVSRGSPSPVRVVRLKAPAAVASTLPENRASVGAVGLAGTSTHAPSFPSSAGTSREAGLADLVDRASAQLMIIRRTLDEASTLGNAARRESETLSSRIGQARQASESLQDNLKQTASALRVLDRAADSVRALEDVLGRIRALREALADQVEQAAAAQNEAIEARFARTEREWTARITRLESLMNERLGEAERTIPARMSLIESAAIVEIERAKQDLLTRAGEVERANDDAARKARAEHDRLNAALERQAAQAQARVSLLVDRAQEQLGDAERRAETLAAAGKDRAREIDALTVRAEQCSVDLEHMLEKSDGRALLLERCMTDATRQAESMMIVARDLSQLLERGGGAAASVRAAPDARPDRAESEPLRNAA